MRVVTFLLVVAVALLTVAEASSARTVRVFAVGNRQSMSDVVTYQDYRNKMFALMDAGYPGRSSLVQAGVDDVASHIKPADPNAPDLVLVNFPEDVGLEAAFIGSRGAAARAATFSSQAYLSLYNTYAQQRFFYLGTLGVTGLLPQIVLAVTDTVYRAFYETFRDLAMTYGVYVTATANLPPAVIVTQAEDPTTYSRLIDPDEVGIRDYVYKAISPVSYNSTFLFEPDGDIFVQLPDGTVTASPSGTGGVLMGSANKVYLTPIELDLLQLGDAPIDDLDVLDTPVGRIGVVISKDAWMVDLNDRLAARHAHLLIQPEAFSSWGFQPSPWDPDIFKQGGYNNLQKYPNRLYNVAPCMTGNLFEITFDGQTTIIGRGHKGGAGPLDGTNAWVGQNPDTGFLEMAPWIVDDPGIGNPSLTLADRRSALVTEGVKLLPGSQVLCPDPLAYGPCRNGYREAVVWRDLEIPDGIDVVTTPDTTTPVPTGFGTSVQVNDDDDSTPSSQLFPRVAVQGDRLFVVWQDTRHGNDNIYASVSMDGGATWGADVRVSDNAPGQFVEIFPDIATFSDIRRGGLTTVFVVWQQLGPGGNDNDAKIMLARFDENLAKLGPDVRVDDLDGVGKWRPVVATTHPTGKPVVVWVDEREEGPQGATLEHLRSARSRGGRDRDGRPRISFRRTREVVQKKEPIDPHATALENEWWPALAVNGREVYLAWVDFRDYNWDIYMARSPNGGRKFKRGNVRVDDSEEFERLNSHPSVAVDESGRISIVWADQRLREPDTNIYISTSTDRGATWTAPARLDHAEDNFDPDTEVPSNQWQPEIAVAGGRACVAWQDNRLGNNDIFATLAADGVTFGIEERVDDSGSGPSEQFDPDVAVAGDRCYVVWVDNRSGDFDIHVASRAF